MNKLFKALLGASCAVVAMVGAANAGGLERGGVQHRSAVRYVAFRGGSGGTYVMPDRKLNNVVDINPATASVPTASAVVRQTASRKPRTIGCHVSASRPVSARASTAWSTIQQPWGAHTNPGANWMGANDNIETKIDSDNYAATCSYKMPAGKGQFRISAASSIRRLSGFKERLVAAAFQLAGH